MLKRLLEVSRFLLVLPVLGSLILTVAVVVMGLGLIVVRGWELFQKCQFDNDLAKVLSISVIQAIDLFFVGALGYITAVGFYKLFISQEEEQLLKRIKIEKLADLENKIIGVVVAALAVAFLGHAVQASDPQTVLYLGVGIALVIASLCLFVKISGLSKQ